MGSSILICRKVGPYSLILSFIALTLIAGVPSPSTELEGILRRIEISDKIRNKLAQFAIMS